MDNAVLPQSDDNNQLRASAPLNASHFKSSVIVCNAGFNHSAYSLSFWNNVTTSG